MQVNPYLHYNGNCEAAFKFYEQAIGAKINVLMTFEGAPPEMQTPPEWKTKIMHGSISVDGEVIMGSDSPSGHYRQPQGFSVTLTVDDPADAGRKFDALREGGAVTMAFAPTFFAKGFGICVDKFGIPWMVISPMEM
ncbi:VOC family protein [uncultured Bradyrhizobium sp.]|uniref:VOC family protein n=1 Tax=uncultured Bradyrhizobium sp. TaxID=199684 RepID=UPI0035C9AC95